MGCGRKAIQQDEDDYIALCETFGEKPKQVYSPHAERWFIDCYGEHAKSLERRASMKEMG